MEPRTALGLALIGSFVLIGCAADATPSPERGEQTPTAVVDETSDGLRVTLVAGGGEAVGTLDYAARADEARWASRGVSFAPMRTAPLDEAGVIELAKALHRATDGAASRATKEAPAAPSITPKEIFYTPIPSGPTCTPIEYCESFMGGWACVKLNSDCSGSTWVIVS